MLLCSMLLQVLEETGYDIEDLVREEDFIELTLDGKRNKLYIVAGLDPNSAQFAPKCKGVSQNLCHFVVYMRTTAWSLYLQIEHMSSRCSLSSICRLGSRALADTEGHLCFVCLQEIGGYAWHRVADLPATREEGNQTFMSEDGTKHKFFMVSAARQW